MIDSTIVGRVGIRIGSGFLQDRVALLPGVMLAAAKHQMLEQVRVTALAFLRLVARSGLHDDVKRHQVRIVRRDRDQPQAVRQIVNVVVVSECLARFLRQRQGMQTEK